MSIFVRFSIVILAVFEHSHNGCSVRIRSLDSDGVSADGGKSGEMPRINSVVFLHIGGDAVIEQVQYVRRL